MVKATRLAWVNKVKLRCIRCSKLKKTEVAIININWHAGGHRPCTKVSYLGQGDNANQSSTNGHVGVMQAE